MTRCITILRKFFSFKLISLVSCGLMLSAFDCFALTITHTQPRRIDSTAFTRLGEFFGTHPADPTRLALFTNPKARTGLFFEAELDGAVSKIPAGSSAVLEVIVEGDRAPQVFKLAIPATASHAKALYLGLTDEPFASAPKAKHLLAWRISILDAEGKTLTASVSPLWEK